MYGNIDASAERVEAHAYKAHVHVGLSFQDVSLALSITAYNLTAGEQGDFRLSAAQIADLCDLFNKPPSWFFS